jgi:hypothetical protein
MEADRHPWAEAGAGGAAPSRLGQPRVQRDRTILRAACGLREDWVRPEGRDRRRGRITIAARMFAQALYRTSVAGLAIGAATLTEWRSLCKRAPAPPRHAGGSARRPPTRAGRSLPPPGSRPRTAAGPRGGAIRWPRSFPRSPSPRTPGSACVTWTCRRWTGCSSPSETPPMCGASPGSRRRSACSTRPAGWVGSQRPPPRSGPRATGRGRSND